MTSSFDVIIVTPGKNMKNFKYCAISLNMVHTGELCRILRFTAPLILISKKFKSKYIYTLNSALCAPIVGAAIKQLLLGAQQTWELPTDLIRSRVIYFLAHILNPMETFYQYRHVSLNNANEYSKFLSFCHFCKRSHVSCHVYWVQDFHLMLYPNSHFLLVKY